MPADFSEPTKQDEVPEPSAPMSLITALAEAFVATRPRKESLAFLRTVAEVLRTREEYARNVVLFRKRDREALVERVRADRQALAEYRKLLERCIARLHAEDDDDE